MSVFVDLQKGFHTDHSILLVKLHEYGIRGVAHEWITSYLKYRKQFVEIGSGKTAVQNIGCGVTQGSVLGQIRFLM